MTTYYDRFLDAYRWQNNVTLLVFGGACAVLAATCLLQHNSFTRKWILPVWTAYLVMMFAGALLYGVYGR